MKTLNQLRESFDRPAALTWVRTPPSQEFYTITATGRLKNGQAIKIVFVDSGTHTDIAFSVGNTTKKTGKGNAMEVFSTVQSAIITFMQKYDRPKIISFTSDKEESSKDSRGKLYMAMANRLARAFNYKVDTDSLGPYTIFIIKRKS